VAVDLGRVGEIKRKYDVVEGGTNEIVMKSPRRAASKTIMVCAFIA